MKNLINKVCDMMHYKVENINKMKPTISNLLDEVQGKYQLSEEKFFDVRLVLSELIMNAFEHSNKGGHVDVFFDDEFNNDKIKFVVEDYGYGFSHSEIESEKTQNIYDNSGRGIKLVRALCDNVAYNDVGNSVSVVISV